MDIKLLFLLSSLLAFELFSPIIFSYLENNYYQKTKKRKFFKRKVASGLFATGKNHERVRIRSPPIIII
jgi:hypothetical protein